MKRIYFGMFVEGEPKVTAEDWAAFAVGGSIGYACSLIHWGLAIPAAIAYGVVLYYRGENG